MIVDEETVRRQEPVVAALKTDMNRVVQFHRWTVAGYHNSLVRAAKTDPELMRVYKMWDDVRRSLE